MMDIDIKSILNSRFKDDIESIENWCNEIYDEKFSSSFCDIRHLFKRMKSKTQPITDEELEWILTGLPMELFHISEILNSFRLQHEVIRLETKHHKLDSSDRLSAEAVRLKIENDLVLLAYSSIITRVENEISFSRELIMGAKKIWDARRKSESSNPIGEVVPGSDLPDYDKIQKNAYIK